MIPTFARRQRACADEPQTAEAIGQSPGRRFPSSDERRLCSAHGAQAGRQCALMLRYRDGDVAAFEMLYRLSQRRALPVPAAICAGNPAAAEDVFQEVWSKIIKARSNYRRTAKFTTFLYHVAYNCFIDYVRRNKRHSQTMRTYRAGYPARQQGESPEELTEKQPGAATPGGKRSRRCPTSSATCSLLYEEAGLSLDQIACNRRIASARPPRAGCAMQMRKLRDAIDEPAETT